MSALQFVSLVENFIDELICLPSLNIHTWSKLTDAGLVQLPPPPLVDHPHLPEFILLLTRCANKLDSPSPKLEFYCPRDLWTRGCQESFAPLACWRC